MNYNRKFIDLIQVDSKYAQKNKEIIGRCKIETRDNSGQINIWVQNLLPNSIFDVYLISGEKDKIKSIKLKEMKTDKSGYSEMDFNFDANNILNTDLKIGDINVIVITPKNNKEIIISEGYKNKKIDWHDKFKENNLKQDNKIKDKIQNQVLDHKDNNKILENKIDQKENTKLDFDQEKELSDNKIIKANENQEQEKNNTEQMNIKNKELIESDNNIYFGSKKTNSLDLENNKTDSDSIIIKNAKYKKIDDIEHIFKKNISMSPFEKQNKKINWVRLSFKELACFEINYWTLINHPFVFYAYKKNKHLILGQDNKNNNYIIGLPDRYQPEYKNSMRKLGFAQFKTCKNKNIERNDYGYWLMPIYF